MFFSEHLPWQVFEHSPQEFFFFEHLPLLHVFEHLLQQFVSERLPKHVI
jgi:hypothetical protein